MASKHNGENNVFKMASRTPKLLMKMIVVVHMLLAYSMGFEIRLTNTHHKSYKMQPKLTIEKTGILLSFSF